MTETRYWKTLDSPCGKLRCIVDEDGALTEILFNAPDGPPEADNGVRYEHGGHQLHGVERQLDEFFRGDRTAFDLELRPTGTDFQRAVWRAMEDIPYGETRTYGELARHLGRPGAARAVGRASATNPIPIVVPCHRVVGSDGSLTGFGGGLHNKERLLALESRTLFD